MSIRKKLKLRTKIIIIIAIIIGAFVALNLLNVKIYTGLGYRLFHDPVTSRTFVGDINTGFTGKGNITYYEKSGIFLHSPQTSEFGSILGDRPFVIIDADEIYVNMTFMNDGASYPMKGDYQLRLNEIPFEELCFRKETYSYIEVLEIKETEIIYSNSDDKEKIVPITKEEYQEILRILEEPKLVDSTYEKDGWRYFIEMELVSNASEHIYIDGAEAFQQIQAQASIFIMEDN